MSRATGSAPAEPLPEELAGNALQPANLLGEAELSSSLSELQQHLLARPELLWDAWVRMSVALDSTKPIYEVEKDDDRFSGAAWTDWPYFKFIAHLHLTARQVAFELADAMATTAEENRRLRFMMNVLFGALAPTNFAWSNPEVIRRSFEQMGLNYLRGIRNYWNDLAENRGMPAQSDRTRFRVGQNLAVSEGDVVHRTALFELIRYRSDGNGRPALLLVPSMINRFYIFDLTPERSLVANFVQEFDVFIVSWKNPSPSEADWNLKRYVDAVSEAYDVIGKATDAPVHVATACAAGLVTSLAMAMRAARGSTMPATMTLVVGLLDNRPADTEIGVMVTEQTVASELDRVSRQGVMHDYELVRSFNLTQPDKLIWSFFIRNYLMGETPLPSEVLFFAGDSTNLSAGLYRDLLTLLSKGTVAEQGGVVLGDETARLKAIEIPVLVVGATADKISPWRSCYRNLALLGGRPAFLLASGGHLQPFITKPGDQRARFLTGGAATEDPEAWLASAEKHTGSWWPWWSNWLKRHSGTPRTYEPRRMTSLGKAPGTYVFS